MTMSTDLDFDGLGRDPIHFRLDLAPLNCRFEEVFERKDVRGGPYMKAVRAATTVLSLTMIVGCVPTEIHTNTLAELEHPGNTSAQTTAAFHR